MTSTSGALGQRTSSAAHARGALPTGWRRGKADWVGWDMPCTPAPRGADARMLYDEARESHASLVMQKTARGRAARRDDEEARRREWFEYYVASGDYQAALELATSTGEQAIVAEAWHDAHAPRAAPARYIDLSRPGVATGGFAPGARPPRPARAHPWGWQGGAEGTLPRPLASLAR